MIDQIKSANDQFNSVNSICTRVEAEECIKRNREIVRAARKLGAPTKVFENLIRKAKNK